MEPATEGGRRSSETPAHIDVGQFGTDLVAAEVTRDEDACLWGRWKLEGSAGTVPQAGGERPARSQATSADVAEFLDGRDARDAYVYLPRFTAGAVKILIKSAERKLMLARPWRRR